jgi:hypothetical protein
VRDKPELAIDKMVRERGGKTLKMLMEEQHEQAKVAKYRNKPTTHNGVRYASQAEAARAAELDLLVQAGEVRLWIGQPKFRLGVALNVYIADFFVVPIGGAAWAEDVKGRELAKFKRDVRLWKEYGPCDLHIIAKEGTQIVPGGLDPLRVEGP